MTIRTTASEKRRFLAMAAYVSETVFETDMMGNRTENAHQGTVVSKYGDVL
jgi:hypothetical protein